MKGESKNYEYMQLHFAQAETATCILFPIIKMLAQQLLCSLNMISINSREPVSSEV